MTKTFIYEVAGREFEDSEAWGTAWTEAKQLAKITGSEIWRTAIRGKKTEREFYARGQCFLNEKFYKPEAAFHFTAK